MSFIVYDRLEVTVETDASERAAIVDAAVAQAAVESPTVAWVVDEESARVERIDAGRRR